MAITQPSKRSKGDVFEAGAPDAKATGPKLRGKRQMLTFSLPPELVAKVDAKAARERRSRANMIEVILQESLEREDASQEAA
jgi:hypothetical protein